MCKRIVTILDGKAVNVGRKRGLNPNIRKALIHTEAKCKKCGSAGPLEIDHIIPELLGGESHSLSNLQVLCVKCNRRKGGKRA